MGKAGVTIEIGMMVSEGDSPGQYLKDAFGIPLYRVPLPVGLENTDILMETLSEITGKPLPQKLEKERARYLDAMIDSHKYNAEGSVGVFGDPEIVYAISSLCLENGLKLCVAASGPANEKLIPALDQLGTTYKKAFVKLADTDFETISSHVRKSNVNLLIGSSDGAFMTEKYDIPLVRMGFPVHDRMGAQRKITVGYFGSMQLLDELTNIVLDRKHGHFREELYAAYGQ